MYSNQIREFWQERRASKMKSTENTTPKKLVTAEQHEHREQLRKYANKKRQRERHNALTFRVGELVLLCWPWVLGLQVRRTKAENEAEFTQLRELLLRVAADENYTIAHDNMASGRPPP
jgi:hypothetical protein